MKLTIPASIVTASIVIIHMLTQFIQFLPTVLVLEWNARHIIHNSYVNLKDVKHEEEQLFLLQGCLRCGSDCH